MDDETRRELVRKLSLIVPRLFDDDPGPAANRLRALVEKHGLHPTQLGISIGGVDQASDLQKQLDEATMASWRGFAPFTAACRAKGYKTMEQMAALFDVPQSMIKEWREIGRVPAVFFSILANAPTKQSADKEANALTAAHRKLTQTRNELANVKKRLARALQHKQVAAAVPTPALEPELPGFTPAVVDYRQVHPRAEA